MESILVSVAYIPNFGIRSLSLIDRLAVGNPSECPRFDPEITFPFRENLRPSNSGIF